MAVQWHFVIPLTLYSLLLWLGCSSVRIFLFLNCLYNFHKPNICIIFYGGSHGKESACSVWDPGSIPELGRSPGEGHGNPLQYSCLENFINRGAWRATVPGIAELERTERPTLSLSSFHNEEITGCLSEITSPKSRISLNPPHTQKKTELLSYKFKPLSGSV